MELYNLRTTSAGAGAARSPLKPTMPATSDTTHYYRRGRASDSRSPCPALNSLANHGYISRDGTDLTFMEVVRAIVLVYNFSYALAFLLTLGAFVTSAKVSYDAVSTPSPIRRRASPNFSWMDQINYFFQMLCKLPQSLIPHITLDLAALSHRGQFKIAHDASFVHPNAIPSTKPDPRLVKAFLEFASSNEDSQGQQLNGIALSDIARFHAQRVQSSPSQLDNLHLQVTLGECSLTWLVLRAQDATIPVERLRQWFSEERLPEGWWSEGPEGIRPAKPVGVIQARSMANLIGRLTDSIRSVTVEEEGYWRGFTSRFVKNA